MSDLISRSEAMENYCNALCPKLQKGEYCNNCIVKAWLNNQPTVYDIDRVVEELEEYLINYGVPKKSRIHQRIIAIVKQGGIGKVVE